MTRYFRFQTAGEGSNRFDFAVRADVSWRYEWWNEFVFGGERDQRIYGLTRITPQLTCEYDVNGLYFLRYVLGTISPAIPGTVSVADLPEIGTMHAGIDGIAAGILNSKIDSWNFTVEENAPAKVEFTAIGRNLTTVAPTAYTADFGSAVIMPYNIGVTIGTNSIGFTRFNLNISNGLEPIFRGSTLPQSIRATGLEVDGRIRVIDFRDANIVDSSLRVVVGTIGTIDVPVVRFTEIPPRAKGYDLPEAEYSFSGFPSATSQAIRAVLGSTIKW